MPTASHPHSVSSGMVNHSSDLWPVTPRRSDVSNIVNSDDRKQPEETVRTTSNINSRISARSDTRGRDARYNQNHHGYNQHHHDNDRRPSQGRRSHSVHSSDSNAYSSRSSSSSRGSSYATTTGSRDHSNHRDVSLGRKIVDKSQENATRGRGDAGHMRSKSLHRTHADQHSHQNYSNQCNTYRNYPNQPVVQHNPNHVAWQHGRPTYGYPDQAMRAPHTRHQQGNPSHMASRPRIYHNQHIRHRQEPPPHHACRHPRFAQNNFQNGNSRFQTYNPHVHHKGDPRILGANSLVQHDNSRVEKSNVQPDNARVQPDNARVQPDNARVHPDNSRVQPDNTLQMPSENRHGSSNGSHKDSMNRLRERRNGVADDTTIQSEEHQSLNHIAKSIWTNEDSANASRSRLGKFNKQRSQAEGQTLYNGDEQNNSYDLNNFEHLAIKDCTDIVTGQRSSTPDNVMSTSTVYDKSYGSLSEIPGELKLAKEMNIPLVKYSLDPEAKVFRPAFKMSMECSSSSSLNSKSSFGSISNISDVNVGLEEQFNGQELNQVAELNRDSTQFQNCSTAPVHSTSSQMAAYYVTNSVQSQVNHPNPPNMVYTSDIMNGNSVNNVQPYPAYSSALVQRQFGYQANQYSIPPPPTAHGVSSQVQDVMAHSQGSQHCIQQISQGVQQNTMNQMFQNVNSMPGGQQTGYCVPGVGQTPEQVGPGAFIYPVYPSNENSMTQMTPMSMGNGHFTFQVASLPGHPVVTHEDVTPRESQTEPRQHSVHYQPVFQHQHPAPVFNLMACYDVPPNPYISQSYLFEDVLQSQEEKLIEKPLLDRVDEAIREVKQSLKNNTIRLNKKAQTNGTVKPAATKGHPEWEALIKKLLKLPADVFESNRFSELKHLKNLRNLLTSYLKDRLSENKSDVKDSEIFQELISLSTPIVTMDASTLPETSSFCIDNGNDNNKIKVEHFRYYLQKAWLELMTTMSQKDQNPFISVECPMSQYDNLAHTQVTSSGSESCSSYSGESTSREPTSLESHSHESNSTESRSRGEMSTDELVVHEQWTQQISEAPSSSSDAEAQSEEVAEDNRRASLRGVNVGTRISYWENTTTQRRLQ